MAVLTTAQARSYAAAAGFSGQAQSTIIAIAQAESSLNTQARHINADGSVDRGVVQINARWHPEVSDACAYDPACAFKAAYRISGGGTSFTQWSTFTNGSYLRFLSGGASNAGVTGGKKWYQYPISHGYYGSFDPDVPDTPHFALDFATPMNTPVSFLTPKPGTVTRADYQAWGGQAFFDPDPPGGALEYFYHLDNLYVKSGQRIRGGQTIGVSGGQLAGGLHPNAPGQSTGPHTHYGIFEEYKETEIGTRPYGPDPSSLIEAASAGGNGLVDTIPNTGSTGGDDDYSTPVPLADRVNEILSVMPGFGGIALALDAANQFPGVIWYNPGTSVHVVPGGWLGDAVNDAASLIFDPANYIGAAIRSILDTIVSNAIPFFFRSLLVIAGLALVALLLWKAVDSMGLTPGGAASLATGGQA